MLVVTDTPIAAPMLRARLNNEAPSVRSITGSVAKATICSGMNRKPSPKPWTQMVTISRVCETSGVHPVISHTDQTTHRMPTTHRDARIDTRGNAAGEHHRDHGADAARRHDQACRIDRVIGEVLQPGRHQRRTGYQDRPGSEHHRHASGEVAVLEQCRRNERAPSGEHVDDEQVDAEPAQHRLDDDLASR